jgi:hypothetical protein
VADVVGIRNRLNAVADFSYWALYPFWSLQEVIALSFGREPRVVNWKAFEAEGATATLFAAKFRQLGDLIHRCVQAGKLTLPIEPTLYIAWCRQMDVELPAGLVAAAEARHGRAFDWQAACMRILEMYEEAQQYLQAWADAYEEESTAHATAREQFLALDSFAVGVVEQMDAERAEHAAEIDALRRELAAAEASSLDPRERESVSKIIIGMALGKYGHDPSARRSETVAKILHDLDLAGVSVSDETLRKYLKIGVAHLPPEAKEVVA